MTTVNENLKRRVIISAEKLFPLVPTQKGIRKENIGSAGPVALAEKHNILSLYCNL